MQQPLSPPAVGAGAAPDRQRPLGSIMQPFLAQTWESQLHRLARGPVVSKRAAPECWIGAAVRGAATARMRSRTTTLRAKAIRDIEISFLSESDGLRRPPDERYRKAHLRHDS